MLAAREDDHADSAPREQVDAPDDRLDAEDAAVRARLLDLRRERIPGVREHSRERPSDDRRADVGEAPDRAHEHGLGEVDDGAVGDDPDHGLHEHERDRDERERAGPTTPALVQVEGDPDGARKDDPDDEVPSFQPT